jgi:hypothetical protein
MEWGLLCRKDFEQGHLCRGYYLNPKKSAAISSVLKTLANKRARQVHVRGQPNTLAYTSMALVRS